MDDGGNSYSSFNSHGRPHFDYRLYSSFRKYTCAEIALAYHSSCSRFALSSSAGKSHLRELYLSTFASPKAFIATSLGSPFHKSADQGFGLVCHGSRGLRHLGGDRGGRWREIRVLKLHTFLALGHSIILFRKRIYDVVVYKQLPITT